MVIRNKHNAGFTLAELLLSVALVLVLAAVAIPSVMSALNNMRMAALNNAATQIANAAQTQMTAKKTAGTWYDFVLDDDGNRKFGDAKIPDDPDDPDGSGAKDTCYLTADDARNGGIVPTLSIDEEVRAGDFIIEFNLSTANVVSVFYADGKAGYFDDAPSNTSAAQAYYTDADIDGSFRSQRSRMDTKPMIGYYEGTPARATPEVALQNPVIWMSDDGMLCVQNPNLATHGSVSGTNWNTLLDVTLSIENTEGESVSFTIGDLAEASGEYSVSSGPIKSFYDNSTDTQTFRLIEKTDRSIAQDVFEIDLNELVDMMQNDPDSNEGLVAIVSSFATGGENASIRVDAKISMADPSLPSSATAYVKWPAKRAKLAVYVTNPEAGGGQANHIKGTYTAPRVTLVPESGEPPVAVTLHEENREFTLQTDDVLVSRNPEAARQMYSGAWVTLSDVLDKKVDIQANVGSYAPTGDRLYSYQIYEIWVNGERVGGFELDETTWDNIWIWSNTDLATSFKSCLEGLSDGLITPGTKTLKINVDALAKNTSYEIYVRTAPSTSDVKNYFTQAKLNTIKNLPASLDAATSRSTDNRVFALREAFEDEFGASSAVASWSMTARAGTTSGITAVLKEAFPAVNDIRVYYSPTPALPWGSAVLPDAVLWLFKNEGGTYVAQPEAFVRDSRLGVSDNLSLANHDTSGFSIPINRDHLFYRVIEYRNDTGRLTGYGLQYVPYTKQDEADYAKVKQGRNASDSSVFVTWNYTGTDSESIFSVNPGEQFSVPDKTMNFGAVQLKAQYKTIPVIATGSVGLMYLEFDASGNVTGYYGSFDGNKTAPSYSKDLPDDNEFVSWGYYVVVPAGDPAPWYQHSGRPSEPWDWRSLANKKYPRPILIAGVSFDGYEAPYVAETIGTRTPTMPFKSGKSRVNPISSEEPTYTYSYNFDTAASVAAGSSSAGVAAGWGGLQSPWSVRHATQIPGYMPGPLDTHSQYVKGNFKQVRDIDLKAIAEKFSVIQFEGSFDGGGYGMYHARPVFGSWSYSHQAGLFPKAFKAVFLNIHMVDIEQSPTLPALSIPGSESSVGYITGYAIESTFTNCHVSGKEEEAGESFGLRIQSEQWQLVNFGFVVGFAERCSIQNCSVQNVSLILQGSYSDGLYRRFGSIVGRATGGLDYAPGPKGVLLAESIRFVVPDAVSNRYAIGGLVGMSNGSMPVDRMGSFDQESVVKVVGDPARGPRSSVSAIGWTQ